MTTDDPYNTTFVPVPLKELERLKSDSHDLDLIMGRLAEVVLKNEKLKDELVDFANILEWVGGSGDECHECCGSGLGCELCRAWNREEEYCKLQALPGKDGCQGDALDAGPCPRCSVPAYVPAGEWVECEECRGSGWVPCPDGIDWASGEQTVGDREWCPGCRGRGEARAPVALGVVYDDWEK